MLKLDLYLNMSRFKGYFWPFSKNQGGIRLKRAEKTPFRLQGGIEPKDFGRMKKHKISSDACTFYGSNTSSVIYLCHKLLL